MNWAIRKGVVFDLVLMLLIIFSVVVILVHCFAYQGLKTLAMELCTQLVLYKIVPFQIIQSVMAYLPLFEILLLS